MFLIDTMVLSELRLRQRDPGVVAWIGRHRSEDCFLSVVTIGEIERGITRKRTTNQGFAQRLDGWLDQLLGLYGDRVLPVDVGVARRWGLLSAEMGHDGADLLIAATALEHGLTVVTRNLRHFAPTGVSIVAPGTRNGPINASTAVQCGQFMAAEQNQQPLELAEGSSWKASRPRSSRFRSASNRATRCCLATLKTGPPRS